MANTWWTRTRNSGSTPRNDRSAPAAKAAGAKLYSSYASAKRLGRSKSFARRKPNRGTIANSLRRGQLPTREELRAPEHGTSHSVSQTGTPEALRALRQRNVEQRTRFT